MLHFTSLVLSAPDAPYDTDRMIKAFTEYKVAALYLIDRDVTADWVMKTDVVWASRPSVCGGEPVRGSNRARRPSHRLGSETT
jgi:hypothetical protein